ncbi:ankyrin repeat domain-containing protein [Crocosphaera chwakensis]|uniref:Uncharacterized protein n=1 Tax=Crocosphaera chwakensis CCY0110 TaxID=391612 RepID=A3IPA9_9CHRO|nr:ankyrin repeat domain-containing protein [Crocosphaera chwakensis]EAZ91674.1 hypothetical protein CY0110_26123 [Crocosphaera chwakensis CCY0110]
MKNSNKENTNISLNKAISSFNLPRIKELIAEGINVNRVDKNDPFTPLLLAIKLRRKDIVELLIDAGADLHKSMIFADTPLGFAAAKGNTEIVKLLLNAGTNPNKGIYGSPLHRAIIGEHSNIVEIIIEAGADVNLTDMYGMTPLIHTAVNGNLNLTKILVDAGANVNALENTGSTALLKVAYCGQEEIFNYLFPLTSDIQQKQKAQKILPLSLQEYPPRKTKRNTNFPLIEAISNFDLPKIKKLMSQGTDVNQFDWDDELTPLMLAIEIERLDIIKILLDARVNLYDSTYFEDNPLTFAVAQNNLEIIELLLEAGADPDRGGESPPLCEAIRMGYIDIAKTLINWNASVEACTPSAITPLMIGAVTGNMEIVEILVEEGADVNATDENGNVALNKAAYFGHQEVFDYLFPLTSDPEAKEYAQKELDRAIRRKKNLAARVIFAVSKGNIQKLQKAIDDGADVNAKDNNGKTALSLAKELGNTKIMKLLIEAGAK